MMISFVIALVLIIGSILTVVYGFRVVQPFKRSRALFALLGLLVIVGLATGVRFGVFSEFHLNQHVRIQGAPIPLVVFILEGDRWTDFVKPNSVGYPCMLANVLFPAGMIALLWVVATKLYIKSLPP